MILPAAIAHRPAAAIDALLGGVGEGLQVQKGIDPSELVRLEWGVQPFRCGGFGVGNLVSLNNKNAGRPQIPKSDHGALLLATAWGAGLAVAHGVIDDPRIDVEAEPGGILADQWYWFRCGLPFPTPAAVGENEYQQLLWLGFGLVFERVLHDFRKATNPANAAPSGSVIH